MPRFRPRHVVAVAALVPLVLVTSLFSVAVAPPMARAAGGISLSTAYPGIDVEAGRSVIFDVHVKNAGGSGATVAVSVTAQPQGWSTLLKAGTGDMAVNEVYVAPGDSNDIQVQVRPAPDAKPGDYRVAVTAKSPAGATYDTLNLMLRVVQGGGEGPSLSTQYPELQGSPSATFEYAVDLQNRALTSQTYHLSAQAPDGWTVAFNSGGKTISTDTVAAGDTDTLTIDVNPPDNVKAGTYPIHVTADAGNGQSASVDLGAIVTGTYDLSLSTPSGRLNATATAGHGTHVTFVVKNTGSADAKDVSLTADAPPGWKVDFSPATVDVPAGGTKQVTATFTPDAKAIAGDYDVTVTASASDSSSSQDIRVTVNTSTLWGVVGVLVILAVVGGLLYVFRVYGRR